MVEERADHDLKGDCRQKVSRKQSYNKCRIYALQ